MKLALHCKVWGGGGTGPCQELIAVQTCKLNPRPQLGCYFYCRTHDMQNNCETEVGKTFRYRGRSKHSQQCRMYSRYIFKRSIWNSNKLMFHVYYCLVYCIALLYTSNTFVLKMKKIYSLVRRYIFMLILPITARLSV